MPTRKRLVSHLFNRDYVTGLIMGVIIGGVADDAVSFDTHSQAPSQGAFFLKMTPQEKAVYLLENLINGYSAAPLRQNLEDKYRAHLEALEQTIRQEQIVDPDSVLKHLGFLLYDREAAPEEVVDTFQKSFENLSFNIQTLDEKEVGITASLAEIDKQAKIQKLQTLERTIIEPCKKHKITSQERLPRSDQSRQRE